MQKAKKPNPRKSYTILHVEPSDDDALRLERALARIPGFQIIRRVQDCQTALAYLQGQGEFSDRWRFPLPDIVVLDLSVPGDGAFELLARMQRKNPRPVMVALSSLDAEAERKRAEQLGADLFQPKVWDNAVIERLLHFAGNIANINARKKI